MTFGICAAAAEGTTGDELVVRESIVFDLQSYNILRGDENGNLRLEESISRAEFCAMVMRLMSYDDSWLQNSNNIEEFNDVNADAWYAGSVSTAVSLGLVSGDGNGSFRPNDDVTYAEAVKVLVCALGYKDFAEQEGGYPDGYKKVAARVKLNQNVYAADNEAITRGAVAVLMYNALDIDILESKVITGSRPNVADGSTFREQLKNGEGENIYKATGVVTADYYTYLINPRGNMTPNDIEIDGIMFDASGVDMTGCLGMEIEYHYTEDASGELKLVSSRLTDKNMVLELDSKDIIKIDGNKLTYRTGENGRDKRITLSDDFKLVKNYQLVKDFNLNDALAENGFIKFIGDSREDTYGLAVAEDYQSYLIESVANNGIALADYKRFDNKGFIELTDRDDDVKVILKNAEGEDINLSDLKENDLVSLLKSEDGSVLKCVAGKEIVSGKLSKIVRDENEVYIDDECYEMDELCENKANLLDTVDAYIDYRGYVGYIKVSDSIEKYAYILKGVTGDDGDGFLFKALTPGNLKPEYVIDDTDENNIVKTPILKARNSGISIFEGADKISVDGERKTPDECVELFSAKALKDYPERRLISYKTNSDGKIGSQAFGTTEETKVFCVPPADTVDFNESNYYASVTLNNNQSYQVTGYDIDLEDSNANVVVITGPMDINSGETINNSSKMAVLQSSSQIFDEQTDEIKIQLVFYSEGKRMTYIVSEDSDAAPIAENMSFGDVFYYALNNNDEVYNIKIMEKLGGKIVPFVDGSSSTEQELLGEVLDMDVNIIDLPQNRRVNRVSVQTGSEGTVTNLDIFRRNTPNIYILDTVSKTVSIGDIDDVTWGCGKIYAHILLSSVKGIVVIPD